jgi:subtilisin family serine protease
MALKRTLYVLVPAAGLVASDENPRQLEFFHSVHKSASSKGQLHTHASGEGEVAFKVIDSIGPSKAKLIEIAPEHLAALRGSHPSTRVLPVVYFQRAVMRYSVARESRALDARATLGKSTGIRKSRAKSSSKAIANTRTISIQILSSADGKPVANAMVVAFTNFATRAGAQGTTDAKGQAALALGGSQKSVERLYVYPNSALWPALLENITLKSGLKVPLQAIDLTYEDCVRHFYPAGALSLGDGVVVGVIDSGIATNHPGLVVQGGQNTVPGENPTDFGDNGTEGHGTHVAGIIASRGSPPTGIRGVAPGVTLRSYRVFAQGGNNATNYSIAKAIDAAVADKCDLLNMSLGGGAPDPLTAEALAAAHNAGVVIFAANGNDNRQPVSFPAANSMCQAVSAMGRKGTFPKGTEPAGSVAAPYGTDKKNFIADFSNIGPETDVTGPGVGVISTVPTGFGVMSGTSMATPAATGAAARLLANQAVALKMPRDQNRSAAMILAIGGSCTHLGFGAIYEGKGLIG